MKNITETFKSIIMHSCFYKNYLNPREIKIIAKACFEESIFSLILLLFCPKVKLSLFSELKMLWIIFPHKKYWLGTDQLCQRMDSYLNSIPLTDMKELSCSAPKIIDESHKVRLGLIRNLALRNFVKFCAMKATFLFAIFRRVGTKFQDTIFREIS
jgi:hypothetical protein